MIARQTCIVVINGAFVFFWRHFDDLAIKIYDIPAFWEAYFMYFLKLLFTCMLIFGMFATLILIGVEQIFCVRFALFMLLKFWRYIWLNHSLLLNIVFLMNNFRLPVLFFLFAVRLLLFVLPMFHFTFFIPRCSNSFSLQ